VERRFMTLEVKKITLGVKIEQMENLGLKKTKKKKKD
jgi:hypothetical protein